MTRKNLLFAAFAVVVSAAIVFLALGVPDDANDRRARPGFVSTRGSQFVVDGRPFRFVGANAAVTYGDHERAFMPETLRTIAKTDMKVVRVWAFGESGPGDNTPAGVAPNDSLALQPFRRGPDEWNEGAFENLDRIIAEAANQNMYVQVCLVNWWRDTGGVVRYLDWVGIKDAKDDSQPYGINFEQAMLFYSNEEARRLYREHVKRVVTRRNTVTGKLYRDDPTIMAYELMNEAQASTGRWAERRAWIAEMSAYVRSLDPDHLITPGTWGYRTSWERREWIADHSLSTIDFCDIHHYPIEDKDVFVDTPKDLSAFIENRAAAAVAVNKPLVIGEFLIGGEGYHGFSQTEWFRSYFESAARYGVSGAMFWIMTHDPARPYGVTGTARDDELRAEISRGAALMYSVRNQNPPRGLYNKGQHLIPRQFVFTRRADDSITKPQVKPLGNRSFIYRFRPESASTHRFEKVGSGEGYIWGSGVGFIEYVVPGRDRWLRFAKIVVRAHLQPVIPPDAHGRLTSSRVTLFINDKNCGARMVPLAQPPNAHIEEWVIDTWRVRIDAMRGLELRIRFAVEVDADQPYGINISNWPNGYDAGEAMPVEVELRRE